MILDQDEDSNKKALHFLSKMRQMKAVKQDKVKTMDFDLNSDSERQAEELFKKQSIREENNYARLQRNQIQKRKKPLATVQQPIDQGQGKKSNEEVLKTKQKGKTVTFSSQPVVFVPIEPVRKWNDVIANQRKGKFDIQEQKILSNALGEFLISNGLQFDEFARSITSPDEQKRQYRKQKLYALLSTVLPRRSPLSCYKFIQRNFNNFNHQGAWSPEEVEELISYVAKYGRAWTRIARYMNRSSENVYDKYRSLGQEHMEQRLKSLWKVRELVQMLKMIQKQTRTQFLDHNIFKQLDNEQVHDEKEIQQMKNRSYNSKKFMFNNTELVRKYIDGHLLQSVQMEQIRWSEIANRVKTKSALDCRNKFVQLLQVCFHVGPKTIDRDIVQFVSRQKVESDAVIDWRQWKHQQFSIEQARNKFMIMKKMIEGRARKNLPEILTELKARFGGASL